MTLDSLLVTITQCYTSSCSPHSTLHSTGIVVVCIRIIIHTIWCSGTCCSSPMSSWVAIWCTAKFGGECQYQIWYTIKTSEWYVTLPMCNVISPYLQLSRIHMKCMRQCAHFVQGGQVCILLSSCHLMNKKLLQTPTMAVLNYVSRKSWSSGYAKTMNTRRMAVHLGNFWSELWETQLEEMIVL